MTLTPAQGRYAGWSGWVLAVAFALVAPFGWLAPLGFATVAALAGLLVLPGIWIEEDDRPAGFAVVTLVLWAVCSSYWSPYTPKGLGTSTAFKLLAQTVLYWSVISAARRASSGARVGLLRALALAVLALALMQLYEGLTGACAYMAVRNAIHDPIRPDLGIKNVAQGLFVLALFLPAAALAGARTLRAPWLVGVLAVGLIVPSVAFGYDAPILALFVGGAAALIVWLLPKWGPRALAVAAGSFFLLTPAIIWIARSTGAYAALQAKAPLSWSERMGYWRHAADWISDHPFRGWGLDASRMFGPGIQLHPHDAALQVWLELGLIGAVAMAVFWAVILAGLSRAKRDPVMVVSAATAVIYLVFGAVSFGVWQEWWLACGALAAAACSALARQDRSA